MLNRYFLPFLIVVIILILLFLIIAILKRAGSNKVVVVKKKRVSESEESNNKKHTIKSMVEIAANRNSKTVDLKRAIDIVAKELPFPKKNKHEIPKSAKIYLHFVLLIASHRNADAKLIAYMDRELKKANPDYSTEIDIYENEGFNQRGKRI
ncbi:hypothetical protein [Hydrogenimonas sp.]